MARSSFSYVPNGEGAPQSRYQPDLAGAQPPRPPRSSGAFWQPSGRPEDYSAYFRTSWNTFKLMGEALPGIAWVTSPGRHQKIDRAGAAGTDGESVTDLGAEPAVVNVRLELWTEAQLQAWFQWIPRLEPRPGKPRLSALAVEHPALAGHRITSVYLKSVGLVESIPGRPGVAQVQIQFYEWQPTRGLAGNGKKHSAAVASQRTAIKSPAEGTGPSKTGEADKTSP